MRTYNYLSNELPRELIEEYNDLQNELLKIIVKRLKMGESPNKVLAEMQEKISSYEPRIQKVLLVMFADIKKRAVKDGEKEFKQETDETKKEVSNKEANSLIEPKVVAGLSIIALLNKKVLNTAVNEYLVDYSYVTSGITKYSGSANRLDSVVKRLAKEGLKIQQNSMGKLKSLSLETYLKRDVMYQLNQANAEVNMQNFKNSSAKFIEVSSHPTARTWTKYMTHEYEDHSSWQGQVYYSGEPVENYEEFESTCGYGEMLGICGINCYHQFQTNYTGIGTQDEYSIKEIRKNYDLSQEQRKYERQIRQLKQAKSVYEEAGDINKTRKLSEKIQSATGFLKGFCERNGLKYMSWRTQI